MRPLHLGAGNPGVFTGAGNNTWLVDGAEPTLVDAGVGRPAHLDAIAQALGGRALARVLVTHGHDDHASGVPALVARWPRLDVRRWRDAGDGAADLCDGDHVRAGDVVLEVVHTPGHAPDHVCFWQAESRALFAGDMLVQGSTVMIPAGRGGDLGAYLASLDRLGAMAPAVVYPGHGPVIDNPRALIDEYRRHRQLREDQVLACLASGVTDTDGIVAHIYPDISPALRPAARVTVEAHLAKLRDEGRA